MSVKNTVKRAVKCETCSYEWKTKTNAPRCPKCHSSLIKFPEHIEKEEEPIATTTATVENEDNTTVKGLDSVEFSADTLDAKPFPEELLVGVFSSEQTKARQESEEKEPTEEEIEEEMRKHRQEEKGKFDDYTGFFANIIPDILQSAVNNAVKDPTFPKIEPEEVEDLRTAIKKWEFDSDIPISAGGTTISILSVVFKMLIKRIGWITSKVLLKFSAEKESELNFA